MRVRRILTIFAAGILLTGAVYVPVEAKSSSEIQEELNQYEDELSDSQEKSENLEEQIVSLQKEVGDMTSQVESLNIRMANYRESMSVRIKYFYEASESGSLLEALFGSESFSDFLSKIDYLQSMYDYDAEQLEEYEALLDEANEKQTKYNDQIDEMEVLLQEQEDLQESLNASISGKESEYADAKAAEDEAARKAAEEAEEARKAAEDAANKEQEEKELTEAAKATVSESKSSSGSEKSSASSGSGSSSSSKSNSGGVLTKSKGVVYYNGHKETWYSTKEGSAGVVTGIPGRYTGSDGIIRDGDGYICVASSDYPKGTVVETSLGMGKVYDTGCASGTIDIYTTW